MAIDRSITQELAIHNARKVTKAERPENLRLTPGSFGPLFAEKMLKMSAVAERPTAVAEMNSVLKKEITSRPISGRKIQNLRDIEILVQGIDDKKIVLGGMDKKNAEELKWLRYDVVDAVAVATVAQLSVQPDLVQLIVGKKSADIEKTLGAIDCMVGVGKMVADSAITDPKLRKVLSSMQGSADAGGLDLDELNRKRDKVEEFYDNAAVPDGEAEMILAYMNSIIGSEKEDFRAIERARLDAENRRNAAFDAQEKLAERNLRLQEQAEATTWNNWIGSVLGKGGQAALPGQVWAFEPPEYYGKTGTEWNDYLDTVSTFSNKVLTRRAALGGARDIGKAYYDANYPKLTESSVADLYVDRESGFRLALELTAKDLFVEVITNANGSMSVLSQAQKDSGMFGQFVLRYGMGEAIDSREADVLSKKSEGGRKAALLLEAAKLRRTTRMKDNDAGDHSKMATSLALDFLELGFAFEGGDHARKCNFAVEGARTKCRPGYKFGNKVEGGEVFAGSWVAFYQERYSLEIAEHVSQERRRAGALWNDTLETEAKNKKIVEYARNDGLIPQVLCGSILDTVVKTSNGDMILGRALQAKETILWNDGSGEDLLFGINKWFENASTFWDFTSSTSKLDFKGGVREADSIIIDFAKDLNNSYADLLSRKIVNVDMLIGAMGGAAGLVPSDPMILNIPTGSARGMTYSFLGESLLNHMPSLSETQRQIIRTKLSFGSDFAERIPVLWRESLNVKNGRDQQFFKDVMLNRGGWKEKAYRKSLGG